MLSVLDLFSQTVYVDCQSVFIHEASPAVPDTFKQHSVGQKLSSVQDKLTEQPKFRRSNHTFFSARLYRCPLKIYL